MKAINAFIIVILCLGFSYQTFSQDETNKLYISTQSGDISYYKGNATKTTDKYEKGSVTLSTTGPILYSVSGDLSINPNESKSWTGSVFPDKTKAPESGTQENATLSGSYDVTYSSTNLKGTLIQEINCEGGCPIHGNAGGKHYVQHVTGTSTLNFVVISIKVTLPDSTPIIIGADGKGTANLSAILYPGDGTVSWSVISGDATIADPNSPSTSITINDTNQYATVTATYTVEGVTYTATTIVGGRGDGKCQPITQGFTVGEFAFNFTLANPENQVPQEGWCKYSVGSNIAGFSLTDKELQKKTDLGSITLSFSKNCQTGEMKNFNIEWTGKVDLGSFGYFNGELTKVSLSCPDMNGKWVGTADLTASLNNELKLNSYSYLKPGVNGNFTYEYTGGGGKFKFNGIKDINIEVKTKKTILAEFKDGALDENGVLSGTISALPGVTFESNKFNLQLLNLSIDFEINLPEKNYKINGGNGKIKASKMKGIDGELEFELGFKDDNISTSISASDMKGFGMTFSDYNLFGEFNHEFEIKEVSGSLKAKHDKFDQAIGISIIKITEGELVEFSGNAVVKYSKFQFEFKNISYVKSDGKLSVSAAAEINLTVKASLAVDKFEIDKQGAITIGTIKGSVNKNPVSASFEASFSDSRFKGSFKAQFASAGPIDGSVDIGATEACSFGYFSLTVGGLNLPLGNSGLKITQMGGKFGFNYDLAGGGNPQCGTYVFGGKLGVADVGNVCEVVGDISLQLGNSSFVLMLDGTVNVLKNNTFLSANLKANYYLPANKLDGKFTTAFKIPSNGTILSANNVGFDFSVGGGNWKVEGSKMSANMFGNFIQLTNGTVSMSSGNGSSFSGSLSGNASAGFSSNFSQTVLGNTFSAAMNLSMNSGLNVSFNQNGLSGGVGVNLSASGNVTYELLYGLTGGTVAANGTANGTITYSNGTTNINGNLHVELPVSIPYPTCWNVASSSCWSSLDAVDFGLNVNL